MKKLTNIGIILLVLSIVSSVVFANNDANEAVEQYINCLKSKNSSLYEKLVSNDANFLKVNQIVKKNEIFNKDDFLKFVKSGGYCSWAKDIDVRSVDLQGKLAVAYIEYSNDKLMQKEYVTLVQTEEGWNVVSSVCSLSKKS